MATSLMRMIAGVTIATLIACGSPLPANTVTGVTIDGGDRTIILGDPLTLTATVTTTGNASTTVAWTSSDEIVATIASDGHITSHTTGTTDITATSTTDPTKSDAITLTVAAPPTVTWRAMASTRRRHAGSSAPANAGGSGRCGRPCVCRSVGERERSSPRPRKFTT